MHRYSVIALPSLPAVDQGLLKSGRPSDDPTTHTSNFSSNSSADYLSKASTLHHDDRIQEALQVLKEGLEVDPLNSQLYNTIGRLLMNSGDFASAQAAFDEAYIHSPEVEDFRIDRIVIRMKQGKYHETFDMFKEFALDDRNYVLSLLLKAECQREIDDRVSAIMTYQEALKIEPFAADLHVNLGNLFAEEGAYYLAADQYKAALKTDPESTDAHFYYATILEKEEKLERAKSHYQKAIDRGTNPLFPSIALGLLLAKTGNTDKSCELFDNLILQFPNEPWTHYNKGIALLSQGLVAEAHKAFEATIMLLGKDPRTREIRAAQVCDDHETLKLAVEIAKSPQFSRWGLKLNFGNLVRDCECLVYQQPELKRRMSALNHRIQSFKEEYKSKSEIAEEAAHLKRSNVQVFAYMEFFVRILHSFLVTLRGPLELKNASFLNYEVFSNQELLAFVNGLSKKDFVQMVQDVYAGKQERLPVDRISALLKRDSGSLDPDRLYHMLLSIVITKLEPGLRKQAQIKAFTVSGSQKVVIERLFARHPDLKESFDRPAELLALKDFLLSILHILTRYNRAEEERDFFQIFKEVYEQELYTETEKSLIYARTSAAFLNDFARTTMEYEFKVMIVNDDKLKSKRGFIMEFFTATIPKEQNKDPCFVPHWRTVCRTPLMNLDKNNEHGFKLANLRTESDRIEDVKMRIQCWRQNKTSDYTLEGETEHDVSLLLGDYRVIFSFVFYDRFWSKVVKVRFGAMKHPDRRHNRLGVILPLN